MKSTASEKNSDVLQEASRLLSEPGRDTRRKILLAMNAVFIAAILLHMVIQLINTGTLPDPARDMVIFPILLIINLISLIYNAGVLTGSRKGSPRKDKWTAWSSISVAMLLALSIVHTNENLAMSMLVDFGFSVVLLFIIGTVLGRKTAVVWFIISALSLYLAYQNVGSGFEYHLLTQVEIEAFNQALENNDPVAQERLEELKNQHLKPFPATLYVTVWLIFMLIAFLAVLFESNMISKVLGAIPVVIQKINIASEEKSQLENDNLRMGMELDVARKIQMMMLPRKEEFQICEDLNIAARMDPASEVGGDFYEFLPQEDGSIILAIGDVTDHGLQSGLVMLMAQSTIRTILDGQTIPLNDALNRVNTILYRNIQGRMNDHRNLTLALAKIENNQLTLCGQHENLVHYNSRTGASQMYSTEDLGLYVGLIEDISEHVQQKVFDFVSGDVFLFYTDGLTEAESPAGKFYGEKRMMEVFTRHAHLSVQHILDHLYKDVYNFIGKNELLDDITVMIIQKK